MKNIKCLNRDAFDVVGYQRYTYLWRQHYQRNIFNFLLQVVDEIENRLFARYFEIFEQTKDIDLLSRIFGEYFYHDSSVTDLGDLLFKHRVHQDNDDEEDNVDDLEIDVDNIHELIDLFHFSVVNGTNLGFLRIKQTKDIVDNMFGKGIPVRQPGYTVPYRLKEFFLNILSYHFDGIRRFKYLSFNTNEYKDDIIQFDYNQESKENINKKNIPFINLKVDDSIIDFPLRIKEKASKSLTKDEELPAKEVLDYGTRLHRLLELVDLKTKDTSFIKNPSDRSVIDKVLKLEIFSNLDDAEIYQEYGYYDEELSTVGFIDLLIVKGGHYYIIDYKARNIFDPEYEKQLHTYQRNVEKIFNITNSSDIHLYLLSIKDCVIKKVQ